MRLIEPPKEKFSWANEILAVLVGEKIKIPKEFAKTVTPIISRDVKLKDPTREFETDGKSEPEYLIIERLK